MQKKCEYPPPLGCALSTRLQNCDYIRDNPRMGLIHSVKKKLLMFCKNGLYFWLGPINKLFKSHVNYALTWILRILVPIKFCKGPIKISNGPLKFGNLHVLEWDMCHWSILRAHHHFGLGLSQLYRLIWHVFKHWLYRRVVLETKI